MRGVEGVWRGASRHQSLIIYRPTTSSLFHHNRVVRMAEKSNVETTTVLTTTSA